jgi:6-phosphofructokinase 1
MAVLAPGVVDVCLIPEVPFSLDKLKQCVAGVLEKKGHCVVCVAEGAGQVRRTACRASDDLLGYLKIHLAGALRPHALALQRASYIKQPCRGACDAPVVRSSCCTCQAFAGSC